EAANALLKTLEEPPAHAVFVLVTTEPHRLPSTITSRTQRFDFKRIPQAAIVDRLRTMAGSEGVVIDDAALHLIARAADGALRDGGSRAPGGAAAVRGAGGSPGRRHRDGSRPRPVGAPQGRGEATQPAEPRLSPGERPPGGRGNEPRARGPAQVPPGEPSRDQKPPARGRTPDRRDGRAAPARTGARRGGQCARPARPPRGRGRVRGTRWAGRGSGAPVRQPRPGDPPPRVTVPQTWRGPYGALARSGVTHVQHAEDAQAGAEASGGHGPGAGGTGARAGMFSYAPPLARLIEELSKLPTVGPKTAQRLAFHMLSMAPEDAEALAEAILEARRRIRNCSVCANITEADPCEMCTNAQRD